MQSETLFNTILIGLLKIGETLLLLFGAGCRATIFNGLCWSKNENRRTILNYYSIIL